MAEGPARRVVGPSVSNRWTAVPASPPPLDPVQARLLPVADLFMALMWSRPGGLSLRTTWVTPATLWLSLAVFAVVGIPGLAALIYGAASHQALVIAGGLLAAALGAGAATVAVYGFRQRRLAARRIGC
jgi:hypothetical protein